ncbi:MAG: PorT family protein [Burkholderiales bacterium]|nr:PorT family protein [Flavobacterium sp.]
MKNFITLAIVLICTLNSQAQIKIGIKAGANFSNLDGTFNTKTRTGFHAGAVLEIKAFSNFSIQPEVLYSSQGAKFESSTISEINYNYITVPVLAKYYLLTDIFSIEAGPQFAFLVNDNVSNAFKTKSFDFGAVAGVGVNVTKSLFAQAHYVIGLSDTTTDANITNRVIQISVGYFF